MIPPLRVFQAIALAGCLSSVASSAVITVNFDSGDFVVETDLGNPLSAGNTSLDGDGFVLQLGYYTGATTGNNFLGNWVSLTGEGSANTGNITGTGLNFNQTTIGDTDDRNPDGAAGTFAVSVTFDTAFANKSQNLPAVGVPLAIRFFNSTTVGPTALFNVVSNDAWLWQTPGEAPSQPVISMSLSDANLEWQSVAQGQSDTEFMTVIPEPSSAALLGLGAAVLGLRRRRICAS